MRSTRPPDALGQQQADAQPPSPRLQDLPVEVLEQVVAALEAAEDRASLAACCRSLLAASQHSCTWWRQLKFNRLNDQQLEQVEAWLAARRPAVCKLSINGCTKGQETSFGFGCGYGLSTCRLSQAVMLPSPPVAGLLELELEEVQLGGLELEALARHTPLTRLLINKCNLVGPPTQLGCLTALASLDLANQFLTEEPATAWAHLSALTQLTRLCLADNYTLRQLPAVIATLPALHTLDAGSHDDSGCELVALPLWLSACTALRNLEVSGGRPGWQLSGIEHLLELQLTRLALDVRYFSAQLPSGLSRLTACRELRFASGSALQVPAALAGMTALTRLDLGAERLVGYAISCRSWRHLEPLSRLQHLSLAACLTLVRIPSELSCLTALTFLDLQGCPVRSGWQHLLSAKNLAVVNLRSCGLDSVPAELQTHPGSPQVII